MSYTVKLKRSAEKELGQLPERMHGRIVNILLALKENPLPPGVKKLRGRKGYRIRVSDFRILYVIHEKEVEVFSIAHRKDIYRF